MKVRRFISIACLLFLVAFCVQPAAASEESLRLVGSDVGICVEVSQLGQRLPAFQRSELFKRVEKTAFYQAWLKSKDYQNLTNARMMIELLAGKPLEQFATELFGESVVLALYPAGNGKLAGVLLTQTASEDVLQSTLDKWNQAERALLEKRKHADQTYYRRSKPAGAKKPGNTHYYVTMGRLIAVSNKEPLIQQVIELRQAGKKQTGRRTNGGTGRESLFALEAYQRARRSLSPDTAGSVYINPRQFDEAAMRGLQKPGLAQALAGLWSRCESVVLGIQVGEGIVVELLAQFDSSGAPAGWSRLTERLSGPPDFLQRVPRSALAAVAGRHDLAELARLMQTQIPEHERRQWRTLRQVARGLLMGLDLFDDVLQSLKPNWSLYIVPASRSRGELPPADALLAFEIPDGAGADPENGKARLREALHNGLTTGLNLLAAAHNGKCPQVPAVVRAAELPGGDQSGTTTLKWIDDLGPYRPAYALTPNHLIFSSSKRLIEGFFSANPDERLVSDQSFQQWRESYFPRAGQVVFVNVARVRDFVSEHREYFVRQMTKPGRIDADETAKRLGRLDDVLQLADGAFLAARIADDHVRLVVGIALARPASQSGNSQ